jgi:hypothetical protein
MKGRLDDLVDDDAASGGRQPGWVDVGEIRAGNMLKEQLDVSTLARNGDKVASIASRYVCALDGVQTIVRLHFVGEAPMYVPGGVQFVVLVVKIQRVVDLCNEAFANGRGEVRGGIRATDGHLEQLTEVAAKARAYRSLQTDGHPRRFALEQRRGEVLPIVVDATSEIIDMNEFPCETRMAHEVKVLGLGRRRARPIEV